MKKKTIFISGVAGFLGCHIAEALLKDGHKVVGCDNLIGGYLDNVPDGVEFYQYDCNFLNSMIKITKNADIIYHCAATAYEGLSVFSPFVVTKNIVTASVAMITAAITNKVERFILCSSMARYGTNDVPFIETMTPRPQDPYGIGKYACEMYLKNLADIHGLKYVIAVPHNIIGPRQKYDDPYRNVVAIMINLMLQGKQPVIYGNGEQKRCFSFVQDVVDVLKEMIFSDKVIGETFNVGPDEEFVTINEVAQLIARLLKFSLKPRYYPERPAEVFLANCSAEKIRKVFDFKTQYSLERGIQEMIDYIRTRGAKPFKYHIDLEIINEKCPSTWKNREF